MNSHRHLLAAALLLLTAAPARASDSNIRSYLLGARAAGMGGAFTALADDGSGPYYNPGGIAFAPRSSLSLAMSLYGLVSGTVSDALGQGHDFKYRDLNVFPVTTSSILKWGHRRTPDGSPANALAVTVYVPDGFILDDRDSLQAVQNMFFRSGQVQTVWTGVTYARRWGRLGVGASGFALVETASSYTDITNAVAPDHFSTVSVRSDRTVVGLVGALGARYDLTDHWRLGLSLFSPELGLYGKRRFFARITSANPDDPATPQILILREDALHATPSLPLRLQAGAAYSRGPWTFAADAMLLAPRTVNDDVERAADGYSRRLSRNAVVNASVGAEYVLRDHFPLRAGFFTDFAASPEPQGYLRTDPNPNSENTDHLNRYGASFSVGYSTNHTRTDLGLVASYATGRDLVASGDGERVYVVSSSQTAVYAFLASAYQF